MESSSPAEGQLTPRPNSSRFEVPAISLSTSREQIVNALRNAALTSGFFQLIDIDSHVSRSLVVQMFNETRRFFQLPASEKQKVSRCLS
jgi:isopenicillin N synthase-like dioxygenase